MAKPTFDSRLRILFRIVAISFLVVAEAWVWALYTQSTSSINFTTIILCVALGLGLLVLGILLVTIISGLLQKTRRSRSFSALAQVTIFMLIWAIFVTAITLQLLRMNSLQAADDYVLSVESNLPLPSPTAESTSFTEGSLIATSSPSPTPRPVAKPTSSDPFANDPYLKNVPWGTTVEIAPHEYRTKIAQDSRMSTVPELFQALNAYRQTKGKSLLQMDDNLTALANIRVKQVPTEKVAHQGFMDIMNQTNPTAFEQYGFESFGENFSVGYQLLGTHLIEWVYAGDPGHDSNQLGDWDHVGIAIQGTTSVLEFGRH